MFFYDLLDILLIFIPFVALVPLIACIAFYKEKMRVATGISFVVLTAEILTVLYFVFNGFTEEFDKYLECKKAIFFVIAEVLIFLLTVFIIFCRKRFKSVIAMLCAAIITFGALTVNEIIKADNYLNTEIHEPTDDEHILNLYNPVYGELTATLDDESSYKIPTGTLMRFDGATALYPVYSAFAKATGTSYVSCSKTSNAYQNIVEGKSDIIFVAAPSTEQLEYAKSEGVKLKLTPIGKEAFVFFVNSDNPVNNITEQQLRDVYSGKIKKWKELGAKGNLADEEIIAYQRNEGSGSQSAFIRFMGDTPIASPPLEGRFAEMGGIIEETASYRNCSSAIGFSFRFYTQEMRNNGHIKLLSVNGIEPTLENIEKGLYSITDYFYAVTRESDSDRPEIKGMLDWILSSQGQELIQKTGYSVVNN